MLERTVWVVGAWWWGAASPQGQQPTEQIHRQPAGGRASEAGLEVGQLWVVRAGSSAASGLHVAAGLGSGSAAAVPSSGAGQPPPSQHVAHHHVAAVFVLPGPPVLRAGFLFGQYFDCIDGEHRGRWSNRTPGPIHYPGQKEMTHPDNEQ